MKPEAGESLRNTWAGNHGSALRQMTDIEG